MQMHNAMRQMTAADSSNKMQMQMAAMQMQTAQNGGATSLMSSKPSLTDLTSQSDDDDLLSAPAAWPVVAGGASGLAWALAPGARRIGQQAAWRRRW